jgi:hypothetical protein
VRIVLCDFISSVSGPGYIYRTRCSIRRTAVSTALPREPLIVLQPLYHDGRRRSAERSRLPDFPGPFPNPRRLSLGPGVGNMSLPHRRTLHSFMLRIGIVFSLCSHCPSSHMPCQRTGSRSVTSSHPEGEAPSGEGIRSWVARDFILKAHGLAAERTAKKLPRARICSEFVMNCDAGSFTTKRFNP